MARVPRSNRRFPSGLTSDSKITSIHRDRIDPILAATARTEGGGHTLLYGPRGTGKTTAATNAALPDQRVVSITLVAEGSAASIWGHFVPKGGEFVWNRGPAAIAWAEGALLVINELDHASEDVSNVLHVLLDNPAVARMTLPSGETVQPAPGFRCIASMNGELEDVAPAVLDRFASKMPVLMPSTEMLSKLPDDLRRTCEYLYAEVQQRDVDESWEPRFTYRQLRDFGDLRDTPGLDVREAAEMVAGNRDGGERLIDLTSRFVDVAPGLERALD